MAYAPKFLDPQVLSSISGLSLRARAVVEGTVTGMHRSPFHGFSVEFAEHREYSPGDDLRYLDWKVFGKTDRFYIKRFEQETNLSCMILVDASASMGFKSHEAPLSKWEYAQCTAAALAYVVLAQQDRVGLGVFAEEYRVFARPEAGGGQWQQLVQLLEKESPAGTTAIGTILHEAAERLTRRGVIVIVGDFLVDLNQLERGLKYISYANHEAIVFHILDDQEISFDLQHPVLLRGLEISKSVAVDPRLLRHAYRRCLEQYLRNIQRICHGLKVDYVRATTREKLDHVLREYLAFRRKIKII